MEALTVPADTGIVGAFGEPARDVLDVLSWPEGGDLAPLYARMKEVVADAVDQDRSIREHVRREFFPKLIDHCLVPPELIEELHGGLLFNGHVECCDGTRQSHDSLVASVMQIGISLVAYQGSHGRWVQRLYRRDLWHRRDDPAEEARELMRRRARGRGGTDDEPPSRLLGRALMEYAERAALCRRSTAAWRMGHGHPIPDSLLLPSTPELVDNSVRVMRELLLEHRRVLFVTSDPANRLALHIGNALHPFEFALIGTLEDQLTDGKLQRFADARYGHQDETRLVDAFAREVRGQLVYGVYRAGEHAPPRLFYAHRDHAHEAAAIAIADCALQPLRGFPMLIDLADLICRTSFDSASFQGTVRDAYAAAGEPARYLGERETRS